MCRYNTTTRTDRGSVKLAMLELAYLTWARHCSGKPMTGWTLTDKALARL